ncbi:MAG: 1-(5-phosphoribosyl)-5-amino-4-imidazole-carboxylate carboxylase, partial [Deltaproteobacteria bacterium]|nr:1-(5-phosphoribosyl)-5-amino-4-imidazole-carboxylate carboxylase [Deltaproteobacteria bacterium]
MTPEKIKKLLAAVRDGEVSVDEALTQLERLPFAEIGEAVVDHHRALRTGFPEVVFGEPKTADQIVAIAREQIAAGSNVLVTRVDPDKAAAVRGEIPALEHRERARCLVLVQEPTPIRGAGPIAVVTAGTADVPVAEEAALVAELAGNEVLRIFDVGVAGLHRMLHRLDDLRRAAVIVVVAGMEGALP